ncbi:hypothetical protein BDZ88DRAFT_422206 [Geranomyces variabilis]|nr:hypothetical protein BDZ88DRAFT_422206 [Geranomyces variabilis]KAJ3133595.1 WD repeat-containing protein 27 [Geranomyces variabilis]
MLRSQAAAGKEGLQANRPKYSVERECQFQSAAPLPPGALDITDDWLIFPTPRPRPMKTARMRRPPFTALTLVSFANGIPDAGSSQLQLESRHSQPVSAARFGTRRIPRCLVTASADSIHIWRLPGRPPLAQGPLSTILKENPGHVAHLSLSSTDDYVSACIDDSVHVINVKSRQCIVLLGHRSKVTAAEFFVPCEDCPDASSWLLSISEDRTFKVWDIARTCCLYCSCILSPYALTALAMSPTRFCIASEDGKVAFYEWAPRRGNPCEPRCLKTLNLPKALVMLEAKKTPANPERSITYINSDNSHRFQTASPPAEEIEGGPVDLGHSVQFVKYVDFTPHWNPELNSPVGTGEVCLVAGFSTGLAVIAPTTYEVLHHRPYEGSPLAGAYAVARSSIPSRLNVVTGNTFDGTILVHGVTARKSSTFNPRSDDIPLVGAPLDYVVSRTAAQHVKGDWYKSVYQSCMVQLSKLGIRTVEDLSAAGDIDYPVAIPAYVQHALDEVKNGGPESSPSFALPYSCVFDAKSPLKPAIAAAAERRCSTKAVKRPPRLGGLVDLPVTFHSKVKSSGYVSRPWAAPKKAIKPTQQRHAAPLLDAEKDAEVNPLPTLVAVNHGAAITCLEFSPSGLALATASADRSVRYHKPQTKDPPKTLLGHDGPLNSVTWSKLSTGVHSQLLLTSSMDGSARLWSVQQSEPLLEIRQISGSAKAARSQVPLQARSAPRFTHTNITNARFFYQDRFIVIPSGRKMYFYTYTLEKPDRASVKPLLNYNSYRQSTAFSTSAQTVSAFACVNTRPSQVVVTGASDKSLSLWDVAQCRIVQTIENAQERAVHTIVLADYEHCPPGADFETTFFTSAVCPSLGRQKGPFIKF